VFAAFVTRFEQSFASLPAKVRTFLAIRVGDEVEAAIYRLIEELRAPNDGVAWARRDKLHVTLKFLGAAIDSAKLAPLAEAVAAVSKAATVFQVRTCGIGAFPNLRRPRVLWTGLESQALIRLATQIEDAAAHLGFERAERPWAPHLTIARIRDPRRVRSLLGRLQAANQSEFGESRVGEIALYRSHLSSKGSTYERLASFPLSTSE
jgi:RNA 2',3'-cyclic 3'-phosphodiesterase